MTEWRGRQFWKMTGSGNDFVFFDARTDAPGMLETPAAIGALCDRRRGIGADGVVFVEAGKDADFSIRYFNRDGSLAELCGNASLCAASLAERLGIVHGPEAFRFNTSSGTLTGHLTEQGPEIETAPVAEVQESYATTLEPGEARIGFARVGVPHLVVLRDDFEKLDVVGRGSQLRRQPPQGANVNFVKPDGAEWAMRTYERGVEAETLACGTGAVATAALLQRWQLAGPVVTIRTRSGLALTVHLPGSDASARPFLRGEGRLVFEGNLLDVAGLAP